MKSSKMPLLTTLIIVLAMLFTACSSTGTESGTPTMGQAETSQPGLTTEMPPMSTEQATEPAVTEPAATEPSVTETQPVETTGAVTETQALPSTGAVDPGLLSNLVNFQVWSQDNQQIGTAEDLIINLDERKVEYIVVSVGGFLGIGSADIPIPWDKFEVNSSTTMSTTSDAHPNSLMLNVSQDMLSQAPQLDKSKVPGINQPAQGWDAEFQAYWQGQMSAANPETGTPMATEARNPTEVPQTTASAGTMTSNELKGVAMASHLVNANIQTIDGQDIGIISDGVVDIKTGDIKYVLLTPSSPAAENGQPSTTQDVASLNANSNQWIPVPLQALGWDTQNEAFVLTVDQDILNNAPSFAPDQFPDTQQSGWDSEIQTYWDTNLPSESQ